MKIIDYETGEEINLDEWEKRDCKIDIRKRTKYQREILDWWFEGFEIDGPSSYNSSSARNVRLMLEVAMDNEKPVQKPKIYDSGETFVILSKHQIQDKILENVFEPGAVYSARLEKDAYISVVCFHKKVGEIEDVYMYLKGRV